MILPYDVLTNIVWSDMQTAAALMDSVASGRTLLQLICSPSGFGKTTLAKKLFRHYGILSEQEFYRSLPPLPEISAPGFPGLPAHLLKSRPQTRQTGMRHAVQGKPPFEGAKQRLFIEARPTEAISLVRTLHLCYRLAASGLLFDDPGRVAGDEAACDILKTSFGMQRTVTFETPQITQNEERRISGHGGYDPFLPPPEFPVPADLRWLWLGNTNYTDPAVLAKLGDHFAPLIARGLNPFWIRDDIEHDHHDLFLCVHWLATEQNLLRSMGFKYEVSRKAVNFYVTHANSLIDLCPRRLELIAQQFAKDQPAAALEAALKSMAPRIIRPKLKLPATWVVVPDGVLLWPELPFSKEKSLVEGAPPRRIRRREREYKRLHGEPTAAMPDPGPGPLPPAATQPVQPDPEPDLGPGPVIDPPPDTSLETAQIVDGPAPAPPAELPIAVPAAPAEPNLSPELTFGQAIRAVYALGDRRTCDRVADILNRCPLNECDNDELAELAQALGGCCEWHAEHVQLVCHIFAEYAVGILLFCTHDEVLLWKASENGFGFYRWDSVRDMMAPHLAEEARRREAQQREQDTRVLLTKRLPTKRKLKAVKERIDRIIELKAARPTEMTQRAIDHIRQMTDDDPRFSECTKLEQYINAVAEHLSSGSDSN